MALSTIHIIDNVASRFGALSHFQQKLQEALLRSGIVSRRFCLEKDGEEAIADVFRKKPPDYTIGFNVILSGCSFLEPLGIRPLLK